jgi:transitional endoplasmic reticulum ATPase
VKNERWVIKIKTKKVTLRIAETNPKFVGMGVALVDPKVMDDLHLSTGDVIEISGKKKTFRSTVVKNN